MSEGRFYFAVANHPYGQGLEASGRALPVSETMKLAAGLAVLHRRNIEAFRAGGHQLHGGQKWKAWSPRYAKRQAKRGRSTILVDSGTLSKSIRFDIREVEPGHSRMTVGSVGVPYAAHVNAMRTVVFISDRDGRDVAAVVKQLADSTFGDATEGGG